ncbi:Radical SAM domain-containing protein [Desulfonema limicola]|uniref:Radical SAM domain-containing protein n=1 Tax=Desulfonema limicola TaxID=45656 RepID=A0A975BBY8_9BACT|nr:radical SAM protein [Desulfonema limicola]QTA82561.1 Radical SAM domain-containing protein [Desulfonema limicola]
MQNNKFRNADTQWVTALAANSSGEIFELEGYAAVGMAGALFVPLKKHNMIPMPYGSELMFLPKRYPVLYNIDEDIIEIIEENPYDPGEPVFPVAAFNSPGYVNSYISAYKEIDPDNYLPLFSYGAVGWAEDQFYSAAIQVDKEPRQDLRYMSREKVVAGVEKMRKIMPSNRLRKHLEKCALEYGCPAGKNFFLARYEAPLPASRSCNASCLGCISLQQNNSIPCSQERIDFTPSDLEIAEIAVTHIRQVKNSVVSFGQGCEGDPLLAADVIEPAICKIRRSTISGTINMNTNGSRPDILEKLFDAGLDSIRISMNSVREACYNAYFRPKGYTFSDVMKSIETALDRKKFVSINYLNSPGFTDTFEESEAFIRFRKKLPVNMIQWRNLNFDPVKYWEKMNKAADHGHVLGMENILNKINKIFPDLIFGYFNPPKEKWNFKYEMD